MGGYRASWRQQRKGAGSLAQPRLRLAIGPWRILVCRPERAPCTKKLVFLPINGQHTHNPLTNRRFTSIWSGPVPARQACQTRILSSGAKATRPPRPAVDRSTLYFLVGLIVMFDVACTQQAKARRVASAWPWSAARSSAVTVQHFHFQNVMTCHKDGGTQGTLRVQAVGLYGTIAQQAAVALLCLVDSTIQLERLQWARASANEVGADGPIPIS